MRVRTADGTYRAVHAASAQLSGFLEGGAIPGESIRLIDVPDRWRSTTYRGVYLTNPWVWACVNAKARSLARLPIHVYELDADGNRARVRSDTPSGVGRLSAAAALDRLLRQPTPPISRQASMRALVVSKLVHGNALWSLERHLGQITSARLHPWRHVEVTEGDDEPVEHYTVWDRNGSGRRHLLPDDVAHFGLGEDPDSAVAPSPIKALSATLALYDAIARQLAGFFGNQARPSGHLEVPANLSTEGQRAVREAVTKLYTAPEQAGTVAVTSGKWTSLTAEPEHTQAVALAKASREEVAAVYGVPPPLVGILDRAIFSNVRELRSYWVRDAVGSDAASIESDLAAQLLSRQPSWASLFAEFEMAEALRPDLEARAETYERLRRILTIDEIRRLENRAPLNISGVTDVPLLPAGEVPASSAPGGPNA